MTFVDDLEILKRAFKCLFVRDSTQHSFSDMVVAPVFDQRPTNITTLVNKGGVPSTTAKLEPRKGPSDAWRDELSDILSAEKLTQITGELRPPTLAEIAAKAPGVPQELVEAAHAQITAEWWVGATRVYHIVRASLNLSGIYEKKDLITIRGFCQGDLRNGPRLLQWATSFVNAASVASQTKLITKVLSSKLPANPNLDQFGQHVSDLLIDWCSINGNNVQEPSAFYHTLLNSLPNVDQGKLAQLRFWISDQISSGGPLLKDPSAFVEHLIDRATNLGLQPANAVAAIGGRDKWVNNCKFCVSHLCLKGQTQSQCVCFNKSSRPAGSRDGQWLYVTLCRDYVTLVPGTQTLKGITLQELKDTVKRLKGDSSGGAGAAAPAAAKGRVTVITDSRTDEITDALKFKEFINSLRMINGPTVSVLLRSDTNYERVCAMCHRVHPFDFICGPMVGMEADPPGPVYNSGCARSQCEWWCWCDRRQYQQLLEQRKHYFSQMRNRSLKRQLDVEPGQLNDRVVPQPQRHIFAGFRIGGPNGRLAPVPRGPVVACLAAKVATEFSERSADATEATASLEEGEDTDAHTRSYEPYPYKDGLDERLALLEVQQQKLIESINAVLATSESVLVTADATMGDPPSTAKRPRDNAKGINVDDVDLASPRRGLSILESLRTDKLLDFLAAALTAAQATKRDAAVVLSKFDKQSAAEHTALGLVKQLESERLWKDRLAKYEKSPVTLVITKLVSALWRRSWM